MRGRCFSEEDVGNDKSLFFVKETGRIVREEEERVINFWIELLVF